MASELPRYAVLKSMSRNHYLRCTSDGWIKVDEDDVMAPSCKVELEPAKIRHGLFNIRSCYNNKYWEPQGPQNCYVKATADKPNEDRSNWACTLFKPAHRGRRAEFVFLHHDQDTRMFFAQYHFNFLTLTDRVGSESSEFRIIDWESLVVLPKLVAFKGHNGMYLASRHIDDHEYHKFDCSDRGHPSVAYEIFPVGDGSVRIKSKHFNKFWRRSPDWIWADSNDTSNSNKDTLFMPVKVTSNDPSITTIALRNLGNNKFCKSVSKDWKENCLIADVSSIVHEAILTVEEAVSSREISNVKYRLMDAKKIQENILMMVTSDDTNRSSSPQTLTSTVRYKKTTSETFERGVSVSFGVSTTIKTKVPFLVDGEIQLTATFEGFFKWGTTEESSTEIEETRTVTVPPNTRVKTSLLATKGTCVVPFSYTQRDLLPDGRALTYNMDDGLYTGVNTYNFRFETTQTKL